MTSVAEDASGEVAKLLADASGNGRAALQKSLDFLAAKRLEAPCMLMNGQYISGSDVQRGLYPVIQGVRQLSSSSLLLLRYSS